MTRSFSYSVTMLQQLAHPGIAGVAISPEFCSVKSSKKEDTSAESLVDLPITDKSMNVTWHPYPFQKLCNGVPSHEASEPPSVESLNSLNGRRYSSISIANAMLRSSPCRSAAKKIGETMRVLLTDATANLYVN